MRTEALRFSRAAAKQAARRSNLESFGGERSRLRRAEQAGEQAFPSLEATATSPAPNP